MKHNTTYLNISTDPGKMYDYITYQELEIKDQDLMEFLRNFKVECGIKDIRWNCQKEQFFMYGEYFEWVPDFLKVCKNKNKYGVL